MIRVIYLIKYIYFNSTSKMTKEFNNIKNRNSFYKPPSASYSLTFSRILLAEVKYLLISIELSQTGGSAAAFNS